MKYSIIINQAGVIDAGLGESTDLIDWAIIDYIMGWQAVPNAARIGQHVWINLKHLASAMPLLGISTKSAISRRLTRLFDLNLITKKQDDFGRLYVAISQFCHEIISFRAVAQTSTPLPTEQRGVADGTTGCCSGNNGVLPTEQHSVVNQLLVNPLSVNQDKDLSPKGDDHVQQVFDHWRLVMGKTDSAKLTDKRKKAVAGRLKEGYSLDDLKQAIRGCSLTPHNMGEGSTNPDGKLFNCLELICRNGENVERFIGNQKSIAPKAQKFSKVTQQNIINAQEWLKND